MGSVVDAGERRRLREEEQEAEVEHGEEEVNGKTLPRKGRRRSSTPATYKFLLSLSL
jgi:hypothetical protein